MSSAEEKIEAAVREVAAHAEKRKVEIDEAATRSKENLRFREIELKASYDAVVREYQNNFQVEIDALKKSAKESLNEIKTTFTLVATGVLALLLLVFVGLLYSDQKEVNSAVISLQRDVLALRTTAEKEKEKFSEDVQSLETQLKRMVDINAEALNTLKATKASYQDRINQMERLLSQTRDARGQRTNP